ncbi:large ribosomal subunit protein uL5 [Lepeophtheirus salmonis]|uniref:large ribosomal subunit protein uL5 n=1 Tax=Lepeophtheirus salmonis TaxID=72036 RepID=UPI001AE994B2|nr:60S ribosomal protein L11-like [Lepeophtheirus salmonis]
MPTPNALTKASTVLTQLTGQSPRHSKSSLTVRSFGIRRNEKIAAHVTVRSQQTAHDILQKALRITDNELSSAKFSSTGTFGFGLKEHIDLGIKYDTQVGIFGMDVDVVLGKVGYRVGQRKRARSCVGKRQRVSREEAMKWFESEMGGILVD